MTDGNRFFSGLFDLIGTDKFFAETWSRDIFEAVLDDAAMAAIREHIGALDLGGLVGRARGGAQAWIASGALGHTAIPVTEDSIQGAYALGATLYFTDLDLEPFTQAWARFLGVPARKVVANIFMTPAGGGAVCHFDANENFTIQLSGTKRWNLAANPSVTHPPCSHVLSAKPPQALMDALDSPLPEEPPVFTRRIDLGPGQVLYVPRGHWHKTTALDTCWSLNICYGRSSWADVMTEGLSAFLKTEAWRASAVGLTEDCHPAARTANTLRPLMAACDPLAQPAELAALLERHFTNGNGP